MATNHKVKETEPATQPKESTEAVLADHHTLDQLTNAANVKMVYGAPVIHGDNIIIPAAEVLTAVGFGRGTGRWQAADPSQNHGSGGGGWTVSRPVAVIVISAGGVRVQPVVDLNKLLLTGLPVLGVIATLLLSQRRTN